MRIDGSGHHCLGCEEVKRSIDWLIKRLLKMGAKVSSHARRWQEHVASASPLAYHYQAVLGWVLNLHCLEVSGF